MLKWCNGTHQYIPQYIPLVHSPVHSLVHSPVHSLVHSPAKFRERSDTRVNWTTIQPFDESSHDISGSLRCM